MEDIVNKVEACHFSDNKVDDEKLEEGVVAAEAAKSQEETFNEENVNVIFKHTAKLYQFDPIFKEWAERGVGDIKILQDKENLTKVRVLMRGESGKLLCNHSITEMMIKESTGSPDSNKSLRWSALDFSDAGKASDLDNIGRLNIFTCRFGSEEKCAEFRKKIEVMMQLTAARLEKVPSEKKEEAEEFVPTAEFTPVISLPPLVETIFGDENENVIFSHRAKLFAFNPNQKEWNERGVGNIKILQDKENLTQVRVLMWREGGKLACNHRITELMKESIACPNPKSLRWSALDFSDAGNKYKLDKDGRPSIFTCRFRTEEKCAEFKSNLEEMIALVTKQSTIIKSDSATEKGSESLGDLKNQKNNKQSESQSESVAAEDQKPALSELFKKDKDSWDCCACYVNNTANDMKCISCDAVRPASVQLPESDSTHENCPGCRGCNPESFIFTSPDATDANLDPIDPAIFKEILSTRANVQGDDPWSS